MKHRGSHIKARRKKMSWHSGRSRYRGEGRKGDGRGEGKMVALREREMGRRDGQQELKSGKNEREREPETHQEREERRKSERKGEGKGRWKKWEGGK